MNFLERTARTLINQIEAKATLRTWYVIVWQAMDGDRVLGQGRTTLRSTSLKEAIDFTINDAAKDLGIPVSQIKVISTSTFQS